MGHSLSPGSDIIASLIYKNADTGASVFPGFFELAYAIDHYVGEVRYLLSSGRFDITTGIGHLDYDSSSSVISMGYPSQGDQDLRHSNAYVYSHIDISRRFGLTVGVSADFLDTPYIEQDQFNPKLGLTWCPVEKATIRAAVFRTMHRPWL